MTTRVLCGVNKRLLTPGLFRGLFQRNIRINFQRQFSDLFVLVLRSTFVSAQTRSFCVQMIKLIQISVQYWIDSIHWKTLHWSNLYKLFNVSSTSEISLTSTAPWWQQINIEPKLLHEWAPLQSENRTWAAPQMMKNQRCSLAERNITSIRTLSPASVFPLFCPVNFCNTALSLSVYKWESSPYLYILTFLLR